MRRVRDELFQLGWGCAACVGYGRIKPRGNKGRMAYESCGEECVDIKEYGTLGYYYQTQTILAAPYF